MAIVKEKYAGSKINLLYQLLQSDYEDGRPREYDISVDDLKVVRRTTDPEKFFSHEDFVSGETKYITITLYEGTSKRNTRHVYYLKEGAEEEKATLSGIEQTVNEKLLAQRRQWDFEQLQKENEELKEQVDDQDEYIEKLQQMLEEEKQRKVSIQDKWGETLSVALEGIVRRNPQMLGGIPIIGQGLAGVIEQDNKRLEQGAANGNREESQVSFKKVSEEEMNSRNQFTEADKKILEYHKNLQIVFTPTELTTINQIIALFSQDKENIDVVYEMLTEEGEEEEDENAKENIKKANI
jgi:hypothetical protein